MVIIIILYMYVANKLNRVWPKCVSTAEEESLVIVMMSFVMFQVC